MRTELLDLYISVRSPREPMEQKPPELGNFVIAAKHLCPKFFMFIIKVSNEINIAMVTMVLDKNFNIRCLEGLIGYFRCNFQGKDCGNSDSYEGVSSYKYWASLLQCLSYIYLF